MEKVAHNIGDSCFLFSPPPAAFLGAQKICPSAGLLPQAPPFFAQNTCPSAGLLPQGLFFFLKKHVLRLAYCRKRLLFLVKNNVFGPYLAFPWHKQTFWHLSADAPI